MRMIQIQENMAEQKKIKDKLENEQEKLHVEYNKVKNCFPQGANCMLCLIKPFFMELKYNYIQNHWHLSFPIFVRLNLKLGSWPQPSKKLTCGCYAVPLQ